MYPLGSPGNWSQIPWDPWSTLWEPLPYTVGKWADVFKTESSIKFLPACLIGFGNFSWHTHNMHVSMHVCTCAVYTETCSMYSNTLTIKPQGRAMAQTLSSWPLTMEAWIQPQAISGGICGRQSDRFFSKCFGLLLPASFPQYSVFIFQSSTTNTV
jgi:hypothetical protein